MSTTTAAPGQSRTLTPEDHRLECLYHLEWLVPVLEAPVMYHNPHLCEVPTEDGNMEPLSTSGIKYMEAVYPWLLKAYRATDRATFDMTPASFPVWKAAAEAFRKLTMAVFMARGLMAGDVPGDVSGHNGINHLHTLVREATEVLKAAGPGADQEETGGNIRLV